MFQATPLPAFNDNYIWVLHHASHALAVDPGDAAPLDAWLQSKRLTLDSVLITHHHHDHIGGLDVLKARHPGLTVYGPAGLAGVTAPLTDGDRVELPHWGSTFEVLATPGHTLDHLSYVGHGWLFCGDTLFACGCGRLFEGTPAQMLASLDRLAALPADTRVACAHEYTLANQQFALAIEANNATLQLQHQHDMALRAQHRSTLPSTIGLERQINPFLRSREPAVRAALLRQAGRAPVDDADAFGQLREWKNRF